MRLATFGAVVCITGLCLAESPTTTQSVLTNSIGIKLINIPPGEFDMGRGAETRVERVRITKPFLLGQTEITNAVWKQVMGSIPSRHKDEEVPVETVKWSEAVEFCQKLSALPEEQKAGRVYRLPTEAEWEYACRAGTTTEFSFGDDALQIEKYAWIADNSGGTTHPVGKKLPNAWGLHDMHGNVLEWCNDGFRHYSANKGEVVTDPQGPAAIDAGRIYRGGAFNSYAAGVYPLRSVPSDRNRKTSTQDCRSGCRYWTYPEIGREGIGFRVAASIEAEPGSLAPGREK